MSDRKGTASHRGIAKRIKYALPAPVFNLVRKLLYRVTGWLPFRVKYWVGALGKGRKYPYRVIRDGDVVVQVGAPRDLLAAGRSRAMYFARLVGTGKVIVVEPDPENCRALRDVITRHGLDERVVLVEKGLWSEPGELEFYSSPDHPASNVLVNAKDMGAEVMADRHYATITVPVDTLDRIAGQLGIRDIRLVSLTTNGAEKEILAGMAQQIDRGVEYVALASTGSGYAEFMAELGYRMVAIDDRGYTFQWAARA